MAQAGIRYNNPFNISLPRSGYFGGSVIGLQGQPGYAQFPDMATGFRAGSQRLSDYISGNTSYGQLNTIGMLGPVYATDPNWAAGVSRASGIPVNQTLDPTNAVQMNQLQSGILQQELGSTTGQQVAAQFSDNGMVPQGPDVTGQGFNVQNAQVSVDNNQLFGAPQSNFDQRFSAAFPNSQSNVNTSLFSDANPIGGDPGNFGGGNILSGDLQGPGVATVGQAAASGGGAAAQDASQAGAAAVQSASQAGGGQSIQGTGSGLKIEVGPQQGLTQLVSSAVSNVESAFGNMAQKVLSSATEGVTNYFGITGNLFVRLGLIVLGVVIVAVALSKLMGGPSASDIAAATATAIKTA